MNIITFDSWQASAGLLGQKGLAYVSIVLLDHPSPCVHTALKCYGVASQTNYHTIVN